MWRELGMVLVVAVVLIAAAFGVTIERRGDRHAGSPITYVTLPVASTEPVASGAWTGNSNIAGVFGLDLSSRVELRSEKGGARLGYSVASAGLPLVPSTPSLRHDKDGMLVSWRDGIYGYTMRVDAGGSAASLRIASGSRTFLVNLRPAIGAAPVAWPALLASILHEYAVLIAHEVIGLTIFYVLVAGTAYLIFWRLLRKRLAHRKLQDKMPLKSAMRRELSQSALAMVAIPIFSLPLIAVHVAGLSKIYTDISEYGWAYWFLSIFLIFIAIDAYVYWTHRLMHHRKLFRHFHKIHHLSIVPTPWATLSVNVNELLLTAPFMPLLVMVMPMHISVWGAFAILSVVKNVANHAGYEVVPNRLARGPLRWWVTTTHHDLHHRNPNYNFGAYFTWWDRWMKTENPAYSKLIMNDALLRGSATAEPVVLPQGAAELG